MKMISKDELERLREIASHPAWPLVRNGSKDDELELWHTGGCGGRVAKADTPEDADRIVFVTQMLPKLLGLLESSYAAGIAMGRDRCREVLRDEFRRWADLAATSEDPETSERLDYRADIIADLLPLISKERV